MSMEPCSKKNITQMMFDELEAHFYSSTEEFTNKMEENFKRYVFIAASQEKNDLCEILNDITYFVSYEMHKTVSCDDHIYHIYVRYETESVAQFARDYFRNKKLHAEIVDDMLRLWYAFETASGLPKYLTIGWLTVADGRPPTTDMASQVLKKFGNPQIMDNSVKVSFETVAEAFGATIALGPWSRDDNWVNSNHHTLKIQLSDHCIKIMGLCNITNVESKLDYFVPQNICRPESSQQLPEPCTIQQYIQTNEQSNMAEGSNRASKRYNKRKESNKRNKGGQRNPSKGHRAMTFSRTD